MLLTQAEYYINIFVTVIFVVVSCICVGFICMILWYAKNAPKLNLIYHQSSSLVPNIISKCRSLNEPYIPTYLWGKSGHCQSLLNASFGRIGSIPEHISKRYLLKLDDDSVISYNIFEPSADIIKVNDMVLVIPGLCSHAEIKCIQAFAVNMTSHGFRVAVYNHTGALKDVELTTPRIFTYGETKDLDEVIMELMRTEKIEKFIGIGFSVGGNILMNYLGRKPERQGNFLLAASVCNGYDIPESKVNFTVGEHLRWLYNYGLTTSMKNVILQHKKALTKFCEQEEPPLILNWKNISSAKRLTDLDNEFTKKIYKLDDVDAYYQDSSCSQCIHKVTNIPVLLVNTGDDPIIPENLFKYPKRLLNANKNALFVIPPYGGHLGFFEGGYLIPNWVSWLDRMFADYCNVVSNVLNEESNKVCEK